MSVQLADVIDVLDAAYPPWLAQDWDSVGLVCGDPAESVETVTVAVDATAAVVAEVPARGLLLAHHPLLLHGVDTVAASTAKGALVHQMIRSWRALFTAHTNADAASPGVSDALADALGLTVDEVLAPIAVGADVGLGRVGVLPRPEPLSAFVSRVHDALPGTSWGVRASGDSEATVSRVAVCGGAGDSLLDTVAGAGVQAYVTADLRHHPADEHRRASDVALVDVAHWASEFPWCTQVAELLRSHFGDSLPVRVSAVRTDPWNIERNET
ncbi:MAG TPA: Nif3-like dinuclear metal center hexameric protein [Mycobacterium sp.]|jgi:dinuclear metal center YbgI/SA1388 family protein|nr:Nif3-like dinuclear metal center hexameric protein [Mycobacterium sp.]